MSNLARQGINAAKWSVILTMVRILLQLVSQVFLARILGPENYGLFGMAMVVLMMSTFLTEFGFGMYILQRPTVSEDDIRLVFTWQVLIGVVTALLLYGAAPLFAEYFRDPRVESLLRWMSLACVLNAASALTRTLLQRDLNFRAIGLIETGGYLGGFVIVGITLGVMGFGAMALVWAWLTDSAIRLIAYKFVRPHSWRPKLTHPDAGEILRTGRRVFFTQVLNWGLANVDRIVIGRYLTAQAVGIYNVGFNLANTASSLFLNALQPAFLSSGARVNRDQERLRRVYIEVVSTIWVFAIPAFTLMAFLADKVILVLYGDQWAAAGGVLAALFVAMPAHLTWGLSTPILWNTGHGHLEPIVQLPLLVIGTVALIMVIPAGVLAAAWTVAGLYVARALVVGLTACRLLKLSPGHLLPQLFRGLGLTALTIALAMLVAKQTSGLESTFLQALLTGLFPGLCLLSLVAVYPAVLGEPATKMLLRVVPRAAAWLRVDTLQVRPAE